MPVMKVERLYIELYNEIQEACIYRLRRNPDKCKKEDRDTSKISIEKEMRYIYNTDR